MIEVAEIFRRYGPQYREKYGERMPPRHRQVMAAIEHCRTEVLGGQVYYCEACEEALYSYHSCQNRHCPKCQHETAQQWLLNQQALLLPVPHFIRRTIFLWLPLPCRPNSGQSLEAINKLFTTASFELPPPPYSS
jgi:hypothetical protein